MLILIEFLLILVIAFSMLICNGFASPPPQPKHTPSFPRRCEMASNTRIRCDIMALIIVLRWSFMQNEIEGYRLYEQNVYVCSDTPNAQLLCEIISNNIHILSPHNHPSSPHSFPS